MGAEGGLGRGGWRGSILYVSAVPPRCSAAERNSDVLSLLVCVCVLFGADCFYLISLLTE